MHILIKRLLIFVSKASPSSHPTASLLPSLPGSEPHLLLSLEFSFSHAKHCSSVSTPHKLAYAFLNFCYLSTYLPS